MAGGTEYVIFLFPCIGNSLLKQQFHPLHVITLLKQVQNRDHGILMVMNKNSIVEMVKDPETFNTALVPCKGSDCRR